MQLPEKHRPEKQRGEGRALLLELQLCSLSPCAPGQPCTPRLSRSARPRQAEPGSSRPRASEALPSWGFTSPWGADPVCWEDPGTKHFGSDSGEGKGEGRNKKIPVDAVPLPTAAGLLQLSTIVALLSSPCWLLCWRGPRRVLGLPPAGCTGAICSGPGEPRSEGVVGTARLPEPVVWDGCLLLPFLPRWRQEAGSTRQRPPRVPGGKKGGVLS